MHGGVDRVPTASSVKERRTPNERQAVLRVCVCAYDAVWLHGERLELHVDAKLAVFTDAAWRRRDVVSQANGTFGL